jgi:hypothetical protein
MGPVRLRTAKRASSGVGDCRWTIDERRRTGRASRPAVRAPSPSSRNSDAGARRLAFAPPPAKLAGRPRGDRRLRRIAGRPRLVIHATASASRRPHSPGRQAAEHRRRHANGSRVARAGHSPPRAQRGFLPAASRSRREGATTCGAIGTLEAMPGTARLRQSPRKSLISTDFPDASMTRPFLPPHRGDRPAPSRWRVRSTVPCLA